MNIKNICEDIARIQGIIVAQKQGFGAHCNRVWIKYTLYQFLCTG